MPEKKAHTNPKVAVFITILTAFVFLFLFFYIGINTRKYTYEDSKLLAKEVSRKAAFETENYLTTALMVGRAMEQKIQVIRKGKLDRSAVIDILKSSLLRNTNFLATWTIWEPNAFDGKDHEFIGDTLYDSNGTMSITFFMYKNKMLFERNEPSDYYEDFYAIPKKTRNELLLNPYYYKYHGHNHNFYETSVVIPIMDDKTFLGVFGIDLSLDSLQKRLNKIKLYNTGYLSLIANNGIIVSHPDSSFIEKNILNFVNDIDSLTIKTIKEGKELSIETISEFTKYKVFRFFYPIKIGNGNTPWSMMVEIPVEEASTRSKQLLIVAYATLFIGLSLLIYLIINILDRRRYENALLASKLKAEESDNLKTAFLNNISHEIRTPLNGIVGFSELITSNDITSEQKSSYNDIIRSSCNQLLSVISNVLELSKIQTGQIKPNIAKVSINHLIDIIAKTNNIAAEEKGLKIITQKPYEEVVIFTDETKFHHILSNLVSNAIKFTETGQIEMGYKNHNSSLLFFVKDTGIGISEANKSKIFQSFTQVDNTLNRVYGGSGIGLSISKAFIELLGGKIWYESEIGKGTTFYFTLPVDNQNPLSDTNQNQLKHVDTDILKVLVAEDERMNFVIIRELLKNSNVELLWVENGEDAVNLCKNDSSINLVLMDIKMPIMNGYEASKEIKSFRKNLPIVAISAFIENQDPSKQILFDSIIAKPYKGEELLNTIRKYIQ
ncbi:MAG: ATP-binding protein [Tenuifilaceae bacterium]